ncbi:MAG: hypothetical protein K6A37_00160 [Saccharofermentans sp.]|nr:hypothetical protein [Saccharofermentans sp.]
MERAITDEMLDKHIESCLKGFDGIRRIWENGVLAKSPREIAGEYFYKWFCNYIRDNHLVIQIDQKTGHASYERFVDDYRMWKGGEHPCGKCGDVWLIYKGEEASCGDKEQFFKLMEFFHVPVEYFEPAPKGIVWSDDIIDRHGNLSISSYLWVDDGGLLSDSFVPGSDIILKDHYGLVSVIRNVVSINNHPGYDMLGRFVREASFYGIGTIEGYTSDTEREILIYIKDGKIYSLFVPYPLYSNDEMDLSNEDQKAMREFPLWHDMYSYHRKHYGIEESIFGKIIDEYLPELKATDM